MNIKLQILTSIAKKIEQMILTETHKLSRNFTKEAVSVLKKLDDPNNDYVASGVVLKRIDSANEPIIPACCSNTAIPLDTNSIITKLSNVVESAPTHEPVIVYKPQPPKDTITTQERVLRARKQYEMMLESTNECLNASFPVKHIIEDLNYLRNNYYKFKGELGNTEEDLELEKSYCHILSVEEKSNTTSTQSTKESYSPVLVATEMRCEPVGFQPLSDGEIDISNVATTDVIRVLAGNELKDLLKSTKCIVNKFNMPILLYYKLFENGAQAAYAISMRFDTKIELIKYLKENSPVIYQIAHIKPFDKWQARVYESDRKLVSFSMVDAWYNSLCHMLTHFKLKLENCKKSKKD